MLRRARLSSHYVISCRRLNMATRYALNMLGTFRTASWIRPRQFITGYVLWPFLPGSVGVQRRTPGVFVRTRLRKDEEEFIEARELIRSEGS